MKLKPYKDFFTNLSAWAFGTAVCHFVIFLLTFILLCFAYTLIGVLEESESQKAIFISKFEKYFTLTSALLILIPYLMSFILTFGLLHKHHKLLDVWLKGSVGFAPVFFLGLLSCGIYLSVEGSFIGYITIVLCLLFAGFMVHSILLIYYLNQDYKEDSKLADENSLDGENTHESP